MGHLRYQPCQNCKWLRCYVLRPETRGAQPHLSPARDRIRGQRNDPQSAGLGLSASGDPLTPVQNRSQTHLSTLTAWRQRAEN